MPLDNWDDLKFVLAMHQHGTMSAAARHLNTNVATVSRRIERLSTDLGVALFEKRGQSFVPTDAAERLASTAEDIDQMLRAKVSNLAETDRNAAVPLEIAAPPAVHDHFLVPRTPELAELHPNVILSMTEKVFAQGLGGADIQIRIGRPEGGRLMARKFRDYALRVYHRKDTPLGPDWIGHSVRYPDSDLLLEVHPGANPRPRYRVEEIPLVYRMAVMTGLPALLPDFMIRPEDGLVPADLPGNDFSNELWIAYHETRNADATLRAVVDWYCG